METIIKLSSHDVETAIFEYLCRRKWEVKKINVATNPGSPSDGPHPGTKPSMEVTAHVERSDD